MDKIKVLWSANQGLQTTHTQTGVHSKNQNSILLFSFTRKQSKQPFSISTLSNFEQKLQPSKTQANILTPRRFRADVISWNNLHNNKTLQHFLFILTTDVFCNLPTQNVFRLHGKIFKNIFLSFFQHFLFSSFYITWHFLWLLSYKKVLKQTASNIL